MQGFSTFPPSQAFIIPLGLLLISLPNPGSLSCQKSLEKYQLPLPCNLVADHLFHLRAGEWCYSGPNQTGALESKQFAEFLMFLSLRWQTKKILQAALSEVPKERAITYFHDGC